MTNDIQKYVNTSINPGDDFFKFATDYWINYHKWDKTYPSWGVFADLDKKNRKRIEKIIANADDSEISRKITTLYNVSLDWKRRNAEGRKPLMEYLEKYVYPLQSYDDVLEFSAGKHIPLFFDIYIAPDAKQPDMNIVYLCQSGLTLANKDYYLNDDENILKIRKAYEKYAVSLFMYIGYTKKEANMKFKRIWDIEKNLAASHYSNEDSRNPELTYHKVDTDKLANIMPFDLYSYLISYGFGDSKQIVIREMDAVMKGCELLNSLSAEDLKLFLEWHILSYAARKLDDKAYKICHKFGKAFSGKCRMDSKKNRSIMLVNNVFGESIGQLYAKKYFSEESKKDVIGIVHNLIDSFHDILLDQDWMSDKTKNRAIEKLSGMSVKIGYPDKIEDYSDCPIDESISYFENMLNIADYFFHKDIEKNYNKPVDKNEWMMNPQNVNAYYDQEMNEICFPAAILQFPFYEKGRPAELNYGGIGVVIGHEMTHGFDNHGRQYNEHSTLESWWDDSEIEQFEKLSENTLNHFASLKVLPDLKCNAGLTLSENLADYGGLKIAYHACEKICENIGWNKQFFISFANVWAGIATEEYIRNITLNNEHSAYYIRVNGTLALFDEWYKAFDITEKDKLYIDPDKRAKIW